MKKGFSQVLSLKKVWTDFSEKCSITWTPWPRPGLLILSRPQVYHLWPENPKTEGREARGKEENRQKVKAFLRKRLHLSQGPERDQSEPDCKVEWVSGREEEPQRKKDENIKHRIHIMLYRPQQLFLDQNIVGSLSFSAISETKAHLHCGWPTGVYHQAIAVTSALGASVTPGMSVYLLW